MFSLKIYVEWAYSTCLFSCIFTSMNTTVRCQHPQVKTVLITIILKSSAPAKKDCFCHYEHILKCPVKINKVNFMLEFTNVIYSVFMQKYRLFFWDNLEKLNSTR